MHPLHVQIHDSLLKKEIVTFFYDIIHRSRQEQNVREEMGEGWSEQLTCASEKMVIKLRQQILQVHLINLINIWIMLWVHVGQTLLILSNRKWRKRYF
jgi:hypothetical protein